MGPSRHFRVSVLAVLLTLTGMAWGQSAALRHVHEASSEGDEVVIGFERNHLVLKVHPGKAGRDWAGSETRMARLDQSPWQVALPEVWGIVPKLESAWSDLGGVFHLDIDPYEHMALICAMEEERGRLWLSSRSASSGMNWSPPWAIPALEDFDGSCAFAVFDMHPGREGDLLVALRPLMLAPGESLVPDAGRWKGGYDVARIPRRGGYREVFLLDDVNTPADEMALVPGPDGGGWLSTERLDGLGGLDPWWCPRVPYGSGDVAEETGESLTGHRFEVRCGGQRIRGLAWQVSDGSGTPLVRLGSDSRGWVKLDALRADEQYNFTLIGRAPSHCPGAEALWRDADDRVIRRFPLGGETWNLSFLSTLPLGGWRDMLPDGSSLPDITAQRVRNQPKADWIVFHGLGDRGLSTVDRDQIRALAMHLKTRPDDVVHVVGHASKDGDAQSNARLAMERARHVAGQLEFAGLSSSQIRFEGLGDQKPLTDCPPGIHCPDGELARSRRTELHVRIGGR